MGSLGVHHDSNENGAILVAQFQAVCDHYSMDRSSLYSWHTVSLYQKAGLKVDKFAA